MADKTNNMNCNPETGICEPIALNGASPTNNNLDNPELIYVGDPMCSWCWGISPILSELKTKYGNQLNFRIVLGGLRPGGGDPWNDNFKTFLQHHWEEVSERSGQPFSYHLFEQENFNYDTEPSCRAVFVARQFIPERELEFFETVQYNFYVKNLDPTKVEFYKNICEKFDINYEDFKLHFFSKEAKQGTHKEFLLNREWGVRGYPSILMKRNDKITILSSGYTKLETMIELIENNLAKD